MPIYEYKCANGHVFDVIQRMSDEALTECQECGAPAERVLHPVAIHFKGSGFHNTDYGKKKTGAQRASPPRAASESKSDESKSSDRAKSSDSKANGRDRRLNQLTTPGSGVKSPSPRRYSPSSFLTARRRSESGTSIEPAGPRLAARVGAGCRARRPRFRRRSRPPGSAAAS